MIQKLRHLVITVLLLSGIGCGGGTRGSGGQLYDGFIGDKSAKPLPGLSVTIVQSGDSAISDQDGRFTIETTPLSGQLSLLVEGNSISTTVQLGEVPEDAVRIKLSVTIPSGGGSGATATVEVTERRPQRVPATKTPAGSGEDSDRPGNDGSSDNDDDADDENNDIDGDSGSNSGDDDNSDEGSDDDSNDDGSDDSPVDSGDDDDNSGGNSGNGGSGSNGGGSGSDSPRDGDKRDVTGSISLISGSSVTAAGLEFVVTEDSEFRNSDGREATIGDFKIGTSVRARGVYQSGKLLLERLEAR
jgi:hypothetical protein